MSSIVQDLLYQLIRSNVMYSFSEIDNCIGVVCYNGGSCVDDILAYTCTCTGDYYDEHCQSRE